MRMRRTLTYLVFASCVLVGAVKNRAADLRSGDWTISKSEDPGKVEFSLIERHHGGTSNHQSAWPASSFQGVDFSKSGKTGRSLHHHARCRQHRLRRVFERR